MLVYACMLTHFPHFIYYLLAAAVHAEFYDPTGAAAMPNNFYAHARRQERQDARVHSGSTRLHFMAMRDAPEICETAGCVYSLFLADMTFEFSLSMVVVRV